ncbi:unnamed protein product [Lactuca virosa]|uniref:Uncharacterized protein n=1 Tax=Lactuca virosa TaxID=75947 RepID=A0AAU9P768_9ASTR|nr:unnamed protein product [Lactuca virosa]
MHHFTHLVRYPSPLMYAIDNGDDGHHYYSITHMDYHITHISSPPPSPTHAPPVNDTHLILLLLGSVPKGCLMMDHVGFGMLGILNSVQEYTFLSLLNLNQVALAKQRVDEYIYTQMMRETGGQQSMVDESE